MTRFCLAVQGVPLANVSWSRQRGLTSQCAGLTLLWVSDSICGVVPLVKDHARRHELCKRLVAALSMPALGMAR